MIKAVYKHTGERVTLRFEGLRYTWRGPVEVWRGSDGRRYQRASKGRFERL